MALLVLVTYTCIASPFRVAMVDLVCDSERPAVKRLNAVDLAVDVLFFINAALGFQFAFAVEGAGGAKVVMSESAFVARHYGSSLEFGLATVALIPFMLTPVPDRNCTLSILSILRCFRLGIVSRLLKTLTHVLESRGAMVNTSMFRLGVTLFFFLIGVSVSGCIYFFVACPPRSTSCIDGWANLDDLVVNTPSWAVVDSQMSLNWGRQYLRSVYFSMQTLFTIGYGDGVAPVSARELILACILMYVGQMGYAGTIANMSSFIANMDVLTMRFKQEVDALNAYMEHKAFPSGMRAKVKGLLDYTYQKQYGIHDKKLLHGLAPVLLREVVKQRVTLLSRVPFFGAGFRTESFVRAAAESMDIRTYTPNTTIMFIRETQRELIVVTRGSAEVFSSSSLQPLLTLLSGDFIGDFHMLLGGTNVVSVRSGSSFVDTLVLTEPAFLRVLRDCSGACVGVTPEDPGVRATVDEHAAMTHRISKLRATMKKQRSNKRVMGMMETAFATRDRFIISPSSPFHVYWDVIKLLALLYICLIIPLRVLLQCSKRADHTTRCALSSDCRGWQSDLIVDYFIDAFFLVDMGLNYRCFAFHDIQEGRDTVIFSPDAIKQKYLKSTRCFLDILGIVPFDALAPLLGGSYSLLRLTRLVRISLLTRYVSELQMHLSEGPSKITLSSGDTSIVVVGFYIFFIFHLISVTWAVLHFRLSNSSSVLYWHSLYWAVTTFTTVGYGDVVPDDSMETAAALVFGVGGAMFAAAVIANVTAYVHSADLTESSIDHQRNCLKRFLSVRGIDGAIQAKVLAYYTALEAEAQGVDEAKYLHESLPPDLRDTFGLFTTHKLIIGAPFFEACSAEFLRAVMRSLQKRFYLPEEWIVSGDYPITGMYFQGKGRTHVLNPSSGCIVDMVDSGGHFGETALCQALEADQLGFLDGTKTTNHDGGEATWPLWARASNECELWFLDSFDFIQATKFYPQKGKRQFKSTREEVAAPLSKENRRRRTSFYAVANFSEVLQAAKSASTTAPFVVYPEDLAIACWHFVVLLSILWNAWIVFFRVAFSSNDELGKIIVRLCVDYLSDLIFALDVVLRATSLAHGQQDASKIPSRANIFHRYIHSDEAILHIASLVPLELLALLSTSELCVLGEVQLFALFRCTKLFRLVGCMKLASQVRQAAFKAGLRLNPIVDRVAKLSFIIFMASHVFGCIFFLIAFMERKLGMCNNWVDEVGLFSRCGLSDGTCGRIEFDPSTAYVHSLYWAIATMATVGYGDIHAASRSVPEAVYCTFVMLTGIFGIHVQLIASLEEVVAALDVTNTIFQQRADQIRQVCTRRKLPPPMLAKIEAYLESTWVNQRGIEGTKVLRYLPPSLHAQVVNELVGGKIQELFFLKSCPVTMIDSVLISLHLDHFSPEDFLFRTGQPAQSLFMIVSGTVQLLDEASGVVYTSLENCTIGEGEFFARQARPCAAQAFSVVEAFSLDFDELWCIINHRNLVKCFEKCLVDHAKELDKVSTAVLVEKVRSNLKNKKISPVADKSISRRRRFLVSPSSLGFKVWNSVALFCVLYTSIVVPLFIAFGNGDDASASGAKFALRVQPRGSLSTSIMFFDVLTTCFFSIDFFLHLTVFMMKHEGRIVEEPEVFRRLYIRDKLVAADCMSAIPAFLFVYRPSRGPMAIEYALLRLLQLTRIFRSGAYFQALLSVSESALGIRISSAGVRRLIMLAPSILVLNHWIACTFFYISRDNGPHSWVSWAGKLCAERGTALRGEDHHCMAEDLYIQAYYWSLYTLTTIGYGNVRIVSDKERIFAMLCMVLGGVLCDAGVTSTLASLINDHDRVSASAKRRLECTLQYLTGHGHSDNTRARALAYFKYLGEELNNLLDDEVLERLPLSIRRDMASLVCYTNLENSGVLQGFSNRHALLHHVMGGMQPYQALPGEILQDNSTTDGVLYILIRGRVRSTPYSSDGNILDKHDVLLIPGALITNITSWPLLDAVVEVSRQASTLTTRVVADSYAQLYKLDMKHLTKLREFIAHSTLPLCGRLPAPHFTTTSLLEGRRIVDICASIQTGLAGGRNKSVPPAHHGGEAIIAHSGDGDVRPLADIAAESDDDDERASSLCSFAPFSQETFHGARYESRPAAERDDAEDAEASNRGYISQVAARILKKTRKTKVHPFVGT